ncbi:MAG: helix-turn-helix transcriptional regulator [Chloracidobacterium sp.]|nr:helix-turn-helix transcriptional regulator [Chloracidobacterium sp.]
MIGDRSLSGFDDGVELFGFRLENEGKTAYWLAKETGIHHTTLAQIRNNQNKALNLEYLDRICGVLKCEPGDLLLRVDGAAKKSSKKGAGK